MRESGLDRDEVFVTSKVWNTDQGYDSTLRAFDASMDRLGFDVLDLYLIHWPLPRRAPPPTPGGRWSGSTWTAGSGRSASRTSSPTTCAGCSTAPRSSRPSTRSSCTPTCSSARCARANEELGVATEAWSPIAKGGDLLADPVVTRLADKHGRTPAQVVLRWHLQLGTIVIPKSVTPARIAENLDVFGFELDDEDLAAVAGLDRDGRTGPHPDDLG